MAFKSDEDFKFTSEEINLLDKAFKDENFCKLFQEYAEEINDPANRQLYEEEIITLEKERGIDVTFIHPKPGYVVKTGVADKKAFINICKNDHVGKPSYQKGNNESEEKGFFWSIPYFLSPPREDIDKRGKLCNVYDAVFHPNTIYMAEKNAKFKKVVEETTISGIEEKFNVTLEKTLRYPKMKYKGQPVATVQRTRKDGGSLDNTSKKPDISSFINVSDLKDSKCTQESKINRDNIAQSGDSKNISVVKSKDTSIVPTYTIKYRNHIDLQDFALVPNSTVTTEPDQIIIEINLPLLTTSTNLELDICEKRLNLSSSAKETKYNLDINLPYAVDEANGNAKFDKKDRKLVVTLAVIKNQATVYNHDNKLQEVPLVDSEQSETCVTNNSMMETKINNFDESPESLLIDSNVEENAPSQILEKCVLSDMSETKIHECTFVKICKMQCSFILPEFCCNQTLEKLSIVLLVNNVVPSSIQLLPCNCETSCQIIFNSLGAGFVPFNYSLCVKFSSPEKFNKCEIDASEDNIVLNIFKHNTCRTLWQKFSVGTSVKELSDYYMLCEGTLVKQLEELQDEAENAVNKSESVSSEHIQVVDVSSAAVSFDISLRESYENNFKTLKDVDGELSKNSKKKLLYLQCNTDSLEADEFEEEKIDYHADLKSSTENDDNYSSGTGGLSPSCDDRTLVHRKRGILKYPRNWRTISESSDEVFFGSSMDMPAIDNEGILNFNDNSEDKPKKSVRFSDNVSQTLFRANSSILGQRKKNQRKAKNKKKKSKTSDSASDSGESENWDSGDGSDGSSISETENIPCSESESDIRNISSPKFSHVENQDKIIKENISKNEDETISQTKQETVPKIENEQESSQSEKKISRKQKKKKVKGSNKKATQTKDGSVTKTEKSPSKNKTNNIHPEAIENNINPEEIENSINPEEINSENKCIKSEDLPLITETDQKTDESTTTDNSTENKKDRDQIQFTNNIIIELE